MIDMFLWFHVFKSWSDFLLASTFIKHGSSKSLDNKTHDQRICFCLLFSKVSRMKLIGPISKRLNFRKIIIDVKINFGGWLNRIRWLTWPRLCTWPCRAIFFYDSIQMFVCLFMHCADVMSQRHELYTVACTVRMLTAGIMNYHSKKSIEEWVIQDLLCLCIEIKINT